ncbi:DNA-dependent ATPase of the nucleotide excision repair factor 4 complex [Asterophora parasitica]|uniref:DNA 5'-3' helicase n=1 Tax=Asterophora parasitica TaxID=117018 RepID=A0A9P7KAS2_9AGAR|nr:DNA-dependent ATPase of the nucleotide excision repair factor 4 complex [Asterophora parasitica]
MCDLKRTLDATVCSSALHFLSGCLTQFSLGTLRFGDAVRDWEDSVLAFLDCLIPTGACISVSYLLCRSYSQQFYPARRKLIYCSRTVPEIEKALAELKRLMDYRISQAETEEEKEKEKSYTGLGLTSRKNLCIHPEVSKEKKGKVVDARCRDLTNSAACEKGRADPGSVELCDWHENLGKLEPGNLIPPGIWTLADVLQYGRDKGICPYFTVRRMMPFVDIIIYSFHYLLDPKVAEQVSKELSKDAIVVFDEAHNIDNVCIESLSIDLTRPMLDSAARSVSKLGEKIEEIKTTDAAKLQDEYAKLVEGLQDDVDDTDGFMANPLLPDDLLNEAIPGNIRKAEHFVAFLKRFVEYLKTRMRVLHVVAETPLSFLQHLKDITYIERRPLRFCAERLQSLIRTLQISRLDEYSALQKVASFATLVSTYEKGLAPSSYNSLWNLSFCKTLPSGFLLILEPFETDNATVPNPVFHFTCLDPSLAIKPVFERFSSVVITSGTISPLDMYPKMLQFTPVVQETYPMTLTRNAFLPLVITRGSDQVAISSRFEVRNDPAVVRNFGSILIEYSKIVPDGIVAFFPSYLYMESIVAAWNDMGILNEVWKHKLIFVETPDANETSIALENYRRACDNGRGAVLLSVARGKVSEGIDFDHNYGRAVIMFGVPYQYTESRILKARLEYLRDAYRIRESEFLGFDAMRNAAQCVGRVLRGKTDWGLMVFADKRFARADKRAKLPRWINQYITETASNLSTDMALTLSKLFMRTISQNPNENQTGISLWTLEDVEKAQAKQKALALEAAQEREAHNDDEDEYGDGGINDDMLVDFDLDV